MFGLGKKEVEHRAHELLDALVEKHDLGLKLGLSTHMSVQQLIEYSILLVANGYEGQLVGNMTPYEMATELMSLEKFTNDEQTQAFWADIKAQWDAAQEVD
jgi:hypothetical protein